MITIYGKKTGRCDVVYLALPLSYNINLVVAANKIFNLQSRSPDSLLICGYVVIFSGKTYTDYRSQGNVQIGDIKIHVGVVVALTTYFSSPGSVIGIFCP